MEIKTKILKLVQEEESDLPTLPVVINKIIAVASDKQSTIEELSEAISYDPAMTSKLLKLANSIYYAQKAKVDTIKKAIIVIGFDEIIGIALGMEILSTFSNISEAKLDMNALWMHSIGVATASKELAQRTYPELTSKIFIPALLHDIGKVIFSVYFTKEYTKLRQFALDNKKPLNFAENAIFKLNHATLSALLMKRWKFPQSILVPCRFHHNPESSPIKFKPQSVIINMANYLAQKANIGHSGNSVPTMLKNALTSKGINQHKLELIIKQLRRKKEEIKVFFDIMTEG